MLDRSGVVSRKAKRQWYRASENLQSICHDVLGLNYLDGMSKSAADGDIV